MQEHSTIFFIRRHNKICEDNETLFKEMHPSLHFKFLDIIAGFTENKVLYMNGYLEASDYGTMSLMSSSVPCAVDGTIHYNHVDAVQGSDGSCTIKKGNHKGKNLPPGISREDYRNYMYMPVKSFWIIAEDDNYKLTIYEGIMFNIVDSEENNVAHKGLPGWHPPATANRPSLLIAIDMHDHLAENNTSLIESLTKGKNLIPLTGCHHKFYTTISGQWC